MANEKLLIIKVTYNGVTKKIPYSNEDVTFDEFIVMVQRVFKMSEPIPETATLKYLDEEKDWITLSDTEELVFAMSTSDYLRIRIDTVPQLKIDSNALVELRREFMKLQTALASVIERIDELSLTVRNNATLPEAFSKSVEIKNTSDNANKIPAHSIANSELPKYRPPHTSSVHDYPPPMYPEPSKPTPDSYRPWNQPTTMTNVSQRPQYPVGPRMIQRPPFRVEGMAPSQISAIDGQNTEKTPEQIYTNPAQMQTRFPINVPNSQHYQNPQMGYHQMYTRMPQGYPQAPPPGVPQPQLQQSPNIYQGGYVPQQRNPDGQPSMPPSMPPQQH